MTEEKNFKLYSVFAGLFTAVLILSNVTSAKIIALGPFTMPGGVVVFPISFIFNDILTETYGYFRARKVIWTGFACQTLAVLTYWIVGALPAASFWPYQEAYERIFGAVPRIVLASITAYFCGEFANSVILSKMKYTVSGRRGFSQAWRFVASTIVGEAADSLVFMTIAFGGSLTSPDLLKSVLSLYVFKVAYEVVATPVSTRFANWVKHVEGVDHLDRPEETNYNPFIIFVPTFRRFMRTRVIPDRE